LILNIKERPKKRLKFAIPLILLASIFMALMGATVKFGSANLTAESMVFWRNFVSMIILLPWLLFYPPKGALPKKIKTKQWRIHLVRGVCSFFAAFLYFYSLKFLDLTSATLLFNTIPIFVPIIVFIWKKIIIQHRLWWAIGIAFLGIIMILHPGGKIFQYASLLALLSGIVGAISLVALRFAHYSESPPVMLFYLFNICMICSGIISLFTFKANWMNLNAFDFRLLILLGIFGFLYQFCLNSAIKFAPIRLLSPFIYMAVIFTMILDKVIWKVSFSPLTYVGFVLIVLGAFLMLWLYPKDDLKIKT